MGEDLEKYAQHDKVRITKIRCISCNSEQAALVSVISDKRPIRYHGKFQCIVSLKFCRSFLLVLKIRNSNFEFFELVF